MGWIKVSKLKNLMHKNNVDVEVVEFVNTSGKAGAQIPHLPLGDDSSPWGR
jgi:hypothetical protein